MKSIFYKDDSDLLDILEARNDDEIEKRAALIKLLGIEKEELNQIAVDNDILSFKDQKWLVYTDEEAQNAYEARLENYLYDYILEQIPSDLHCYFDGKRWLKDAAMNNSRGDKLALYNGREKEVQVDVCFYYLYRIK